MVGIRSGPDALKFLQGMITNDMKTLGARHDSQYAAMLNGKGRTLFECHVSVAADAAPSVAPGAAPAALTSFYVDVHEKDAEAAVTHLNRYKLRSQVVVTDVSADLGVFAVLPEALQVPTSALAPSAETAKVLESLRSLPSSAMGTAQYDQRCAAALGLRVIGPRDALAAALQANSIKLLDFSVYDVFRVLLGLPEGCVARVLSLPR